MGRTKSIPSEVWCCHTDLQAISSLPGDKSKTCQCWEINGTVACLHSDWGTIQTPFSFTSSNFSIYGSLTVLKDKLTSQAVGKCHYLKADWFCFDTSKKNKSPLRGYAVTGWWISTMVQKGGCGVKVLLQITCFKFKCLTHISDARLGRPGR